MRAPRISKVNYSLIHWHDFRLKLFGESILIGFFVGVVIVAFRYLLEQGGYDSNKFYINNNNIY